MAYAEDIQTEDTGDVGMPREPRVDPRQFVMEVTEGEYSNNLAEVMDDDELTRYGKTVLEEYNIDKESQKDWLTRMEKGLDLARMVKEDKNYPFPKASNVKYPLVTSAALQFNARAYPAIVPSGDFVQCKTFGKDQSGRKAARGERVASHMSWQLSSDIDGWEEDTDQLLTLLPLCGTMFRKVWEDPAFGKPRAKLCNPGSVIVNNNVQSLDSAPRISEELDLYPYEVTERMLTGVFREVELKESDGEDDSQAPMRFIEQHCRMDMDEDGYPEPYIVTVHEESETVVRIVADFEKEDVALGQDGRIQGIRRNDHFIDYHFLPSMDGTFMGTGLGLLLGDISESINTIINQLIDSGHLSSLGGGFIGREFRMKGGAQRISPGEYKMVSATGADVRSGVVPLTFPQPSPVLFQMLGMLIEAGRELASVKDVITGDAQRQQTATTTLALIEQGMMVFTAAYKRIFRGLKREYKMIAGINRRVVDPQRYLEFHDEIPPEVMAAMQSGQQLPPELANMEIPDPRRDYDLQDMDIQPVADPRSVTSMQSMARAQLLMELSQAGIVDPGESTRRILEAAQIRDTEELTPKPDPMAERNAEFMNIMQEVEIRLKLAEIDEKRAKAIKAMAEAESEEENREIDNTVKVLEALREQVVELDKRRMGSMAGASGDGGGQGGSDASRDLAKAAGLANLLGQLDSGPERMGPGGGVGTGSVGPV